MAASYETFLQMKSFVDFNDDDSKNLMSLTPIFQKHGRGITDAFYEVDLRGNLLLFNEAYLKLFGYRQEEMMGIGYKRYVEKKQADIAFRAFSQVYKTGKPLSRMEWEIINKNGEAR
ncbi:MAG TPA: PAS domain S-box protein, partial [Myxococcota bacterium]|nr:PAS domain S-box protein [Myxococcota bacterium]